MWVVFGKILDWFKNLFKKDKCDFCGSKEDVGQFLAEVETIDGPWKAKLCRSCATLLDVIYIKTSEMEEDDGSLGIR